MCVQGIKAYKKIVIEVRSLSYGILMENRGVFMLIA